MLLVTRLLFALCALAAVSRHANYAHAQIRQARAPQRIFAPDSFWITSWTRGGKAEPELLVEPRQVTVSGNMLIVFDEGTREVGGFDGRTGTSRFVLKATGEGPGEFKRPQQIASSATDFVVVDAATSRITRYDNNGGYQRTDVHADAGQIEALCLRERSQILAKYSGARNALRLVQASGTRVMQRSTASDEDVLDAPSFANSARIPRACASQRTALVPLFGASWFVVSGNGALTRYPFIEAGQAPIVGTTTKGKKRGGGVIIETQIAEVSPITRDAMQIGDTLIVNVAASAKNPGRLLDYYSLATGRYLYSRKLFTFLDGLTIGSDGTFYGTSIGDEHSAVLAFRPAMSLPKRQPRSAPAPERKGTMKR